MREKIETALLDYKEGKVLLWQAIDQIEALIEQAKRETAEELYEDIICPMCYSLNPQHASMNYGEGCHYCQEREDYNALKEE